MNDDGSHGSRVTGALGVADGFAVVHLEARLAADGADVWSALTDPRRLGVWLGDLEGDLRVGGEVRARFAATGWEGTLRVEACDPPRRFSVRTTSPGEPTCVIEVRLAADGDQTVAVFEDRGLPREQLAAYGAGDQVLVEDLAAYLGGRDRCDARARWQELHPAYQRLSEGLARPEAQGA